MTGKEWNVGAGKRNKTSIDFKFTNAGGRYYTPIDVASSQTTGREQLSTNVYSSQYPNYTRMDIKPSNFWISHKDKTSGNQVAFNRLYPNLYETSIVNATNTSKYSTIEVTESIARLINKTLILDKIIQSFSLLDLSLKTIQTI